jgi:hypothetical protein
MAIDNHNKSEGSINKKFILVFENGLEKEIDKQKGKKRHNVGVPNKIGIFNNYRRNRKKESRN